MINSSAGLTTSLVGATATSAANADISTAVQASVSIGVNCAPASAGTSNTMVGYNAAANSKRGGLDTLFGYGVAPNLSGNGNVYVGGLAALAATSGSANVAIGVGAAPGLVTGASNVAIGARADCRDVAGGGTATLAVAVGAGAAASDAATSLGAAAASDGSGSVALGSGVVVSGAGHFSIARRIEGYYASTGGSAGGDSARAYDTYAVQVNADVLKLAHGAALAFCHRRGGDAGANSNVATLAAAATNATPAWAFRLEAPTLRDPGGVAALAAAPATLETDLVLRSANGAAVRFVDDFVPGVLDFTAQHSCESFEGERQGRGSPRFPGLGCTPPEPIGRLVVATGAYSHRDGGTEPTVDEAVPVVALCTVARDPRVFGVVSSVSSVSAASATSGPPAEGRAGRAGPVYRLGNLAFHVEDARTRGGGQLLTVNAAGEGGICVCDENGPIRAGDLLVSSGTVPGVAMRQGDDVVRACTAAKATCDCDFLGADPGVRLVGCVYKF